MGLIDSTQNISKEIKTMVNVTAEKETKTEVNARLERKLENEFSIGFREKGTQAVYDYYNVDERERIIQKLGENDYEYVRINKIYDKVLRRIFKVFQNNEKYKDWYANDRKKLKK